MGQVGRVGQMGQMGQEGLGENFELGTSYKLAPAGFTLKTLINSESLPKGVAHGCDRGGTGAQSVSSRQRGNWRL